ncbi:MAG: 23S rRNA (guanosine(2251)-2'-O)-methyltransferase RlmB, partial [Lachnospiraceae bacterium]|nr:23S rRNA (guanosine(2251)-2'-O)-methyltransferase RlmB [Lachnospiraceae bacterium]
SSIKVLYVEKGIKDPRINEIINEAKSNKTVVKFVDSEELDKISVSKKHQGIIAEVLEYEYVEVEDILDYAKEKNEPPFIVILDEIEDPHNFGAIIRTCVCAGVHGIIIKNRNQVQVTKTVIEVSSGATNYIKIARVVNISKTIEDLKEKNIFIYATAMEGESIYKTNLKGSIALIVGNEGKGVSRLVKENADQVVSIPQTGLIDSLNASVACGVVIYEIYRQRIGA